MRLGFRRQIKETTAKIAPPNISSGPNAMVRANNGIDPSASPPASTQYQKNCNFLWPVMDIPHYLASPSNSNLNKVRFGMQLERQWNFGTLF